MYLCHGLYMHCSCIVSELMGTIFQASNTKLTPIFVLHTNQSMDLPFNILLSLCKSNILRAFHLQRLYMKIRNIVNSNLLLKLQKML